MAFRLRYDVYVREMGRSEPEADHSRGELSDRLDASAVIFGAFCCGGAGELVGTIRFNGAIDLSDDERSFWRMECAEPFLPNQVALTTKLVVRPEYRYGGTPIRLAAEAFHAGYIRGYRICFIDCNAPRKALFQSLGFEAVGDPQIHGQYGLVQVMALNMADWHRLEQIRSPLFARVKGLEADPVAAAYCLSQHHATLEPMNGRAPKFNSRVR